MKPFTNVARGGKGSRSVPQYGPNATMLNRFPSLPRAKRIAIKKSMTPGPQGRSAGLGTPTKSRKKLLPITQRMMPFKRTQPVPPVPGQKTLAGNTKMYVGRKARKAKLGNIYRRKTNKATY